MHVRWRGGELLGQLEMERPQLVDGHGRAHPPPFGREGQGGVDHHALVGPHRRQLLLPPSGPQLGVVLGVQALIPWAPSPLERL